MLGIGRVGTISLIILRMSPGDATGRGRGYIAKSKRGFIYVAEQPGGIGGGLTIVPLIILWMSTTAFLVAKKTRRYTKPLTMRWSVTAAAVMRWERIISKKSCAFLRKNTCRWWG